jgi:molybdopterin synthase catalytic subunit/molybdopterin converting factor small subunit
MQITVYLFAAHREAVGAPALTVTVPARVTAGEVWDLIAARHPALRRLAPPTAVAVNDTVHPSTHPLVDGDRVALLAPVSGGGTGGDATDAEATNRGARAGAAILTLVREPIAVDALLDGVRHPGAGAVILFLGTVREHSRGRHVDHLEYEAYESLARSEMARIAQHAVDRWGVWIAMTHRLGTLAIGEISVAIAVAAPHRRDAFEAGRFAIDTLKQTVPIWKKEFWAGGAEWIGQEEPSPSPSHEP